MNTFCKRVFAAIVLLFCLVNVASRGVSVMPACAMLIFVAGACIAGHAATSRGQLGAAPDTNDIASELNLAEILDASMSSFKRTILPLSMLATTFRNVQLRGTNKVDVPYYPLQGIASKDFNGSYTVTSGAGSKTEKREININKRKFQKLELTGYELARMPMFDARRMGALKGEKLAYDVIQDVLSVVTAANFPSVAFSGAASGFDSDDVIDIRTACNKNTTGVGSVTDGVTTNGSATVTSATAAFTFSDIGAGISGTGIPAGATIAGVTSATSITLSANATATGTGVTLTLTRPVVPWPESGRGLLVNPDYDGALLKDNAFKQAYSIGTTAPIQQGRLPNIFGFDYGQSAAIPSNGENLVGMAVYQSAILAAFSPIAPPPAVAKLMTRYEIVTDEETGISLEYRVWGAPNEDTEHHVIECNYGYAAGEAMALKRIKSA